MNGAMELLAFAGVMALGQFSPGPDMILLTRTALRTGTRSGVEMALGIACGLAVHATLAVGGLALAFERLPVMREVLRWVAVAYLMWLGYRMLVEVFVSWYSGAKVEIDTRTSARQPFLRGLFCNLLNPKAAIFIAAVSAPFLRGERPDWWPFAIWGIVVGQAGILWSLWACLLQWRPLRSRYESAGRWIDGAFGIALGALAVRLAVG
jgi:threonine/homoserine/homoserine lactone efflux protein